MSDQTQDDKDLEEFCALVGTQVPEIERCKFKISVNEGEPVQCSNIATEKRVGRGGREMRLCPEHADLWDRVVNA